MGIDSRLPLKSIGSWTKHRHVVEHNNSKIFNYVLAESPIIANIRMQRFPKGAKILNVHIYKLTINEIIIIIKYNKYI